MNMETGECKEPHHECAYGYVSIHRYTSLHFNDNGIWAAHFVINLLDSGIEKHKTWVG